MSTEKIHIAVYVPPALDALLKELADAEYRSKNSVCRQALEEFVKRKKGGAAPQQKA